MSRLCRDCDVYILHRLKSLDDIRYWRLEILDYVYVKSSLSGGYKVWMV